MTTASSAPALHPSHSAAEPEIVAIPIGMIDPNPHNPRRITDADPSLPPLAASVAQHGLQQPIKVRRRGTRFEIIFGERRWRACKLAGVKSILCLVEDLDDETAYDLTIVENLQRTDLHWLEEARGVAYYEKERKWSIDQIAAKLDRSPTWVALRQKLAAMSPSWVKACADPKSDAYEISIAKLEIIARMPHAVQEEILSEDMWEVKDSTPAELREHIDRAYLMKLSAAAWDLDDATLLPKAGACSACPKRTSCQQHLFQQAKGDVCTDVSCWKAKAQAMQARKVAELKAAAPQAKIVTDTYSSQVKGALGRSQYDLVKPTTKGAEPAILIGEDKAPKLVHVVTGKGRTGKDSASIPSGRKLAPSEPKPAKARLSEFMKRRRRAEVGLLIAKLGGDPSESPYSAARRSSFKACAADVKQPPLVDSAALAICLGIEQRHHYGQSRWQNADKVIELSEKELATAAWLAVRTSVVQALAWDAEHGDTKGAQLVAGITAVDWKAIVAKAQDELPLPKTLAEHFLEDGKPREKALVTKPKAKVKPKAAAKAGKAGAK